MELEQIFTEALEYGRQSIPQGQVATYIPELAKADPSWLSVCAVTTDLQSYAYGDCTQKFTLQSIAKVISLILALETVGEDVVFQKVGMEPTGDPFNSIVKLEKVSTHTPYNPMINAGAISVASNIPGANLEERFDAFLRFTRKICGNEEISLSFETYLSEKRTGDRNRALAYMMKSGGVLEGSVEEHLDLYFMICSVLATCRDIAFLGAVLANNGVHPVTGEPLIGPRHLKIVRSLMVTCGMYDASGYFATMVGLPSKSGVGGGIVSVVPNVMGIGVFGPALDERGNSIGGVKILEYLSDRLNLSIF